jgi:hypothetical protein
LHPQRDDYDDGALDTGAGVCKKSKIDDREPSPWPLLLLPLDSDDD